MGLPYSRQINAAFEQVTPLVAAGFEVLRTTRDISILLAVIQVLTVIFLGAIFFALVALLYTVNPDLEIERQVLITPTLRYVASITLWSITKSLLSFVAFVGTAGVVAWRLFLAKQWINDVEYEANVDAERALEELDGENGDEKDGNKEDGDKKDGGKNEGKGTGKAKKK